MYGSASRSSDRDVKASAIVADIIVIDAQEKCPSLERPEGSPRANKEDSIWHNTDPRHALGAIQRAETGPLDPRLGNENTDQGIKLRYTLEPDAVGLVKG